LAKKDNNIFAMVLAGVGALVAALIGVNELSKAKSRGNNGSFGPPPKKSGGCGCNGGL
jgi:hypothetical protein